MEQPRTSAAAIVSLVLGIGAFCLGFLSGIPAIITGAVGLSNIGKSNGMLTGRGLAIAGIATGGVGTMLTVVLVALLLPAVQTAREAARRAQSNNNLKQIGLALHNYHEVFQVFPPGGVFDGSDRMYHGWQTQLLPYVDRGDLLNSVDFDTPWDDPANASVFQQEVDVYQVPGVEDKYDASGFALSHYSGNSNLFNKNSSMRISKVTDGASNTIMAGEVAANFKPWGHPANWRDPAAGVDGGPDSFGRSSGNGAQFLMIDASVKFIKDDIDPDVLKALSTPAGGERVPPSF